MPILVLVELGAAVQGWQSRSWTSSGSEALSQPILQQSLYPHLTHVWDAPPPSAKCFVTRSQELEAKAAWQPWLRQGCVSGAFSCKLPRSHRPCSHPQLCSATKVTAGR